MYSNQKEVARILDRNIDVLKQTFGQEATLTAVCEIAACMVSSLKAGGKVLLCGNGGSAADAQHIAGELIGRFKLERKSYPAIALTTDTSVLTCVANDYTFEDVFRRQVEGLGKEGDVLVGISTSGNSENVLRAVRQARQMRLVTVSFTGGSGGKLKEMTDFNLNVLSDYTPYIQSGHCLAYHAICEMVEKELAASAL